MRRLAVAVAFLALAGIARATGIYGFAAGSFMHGGGTQVPDVVGLSQSAADTALTGVGLLTGAVTQLCSAATVNIVLTQSPAAGTPVVPGIAVDLWTSSGTACINGQPRIGIAIGIGL